MGSYISSEPRVKGIRDGYELKSSQRRHYVGNIVGNHWTELLLYFAQYVNKYLSTHLNSRSVSTASNVQVRSPINSKSIAGWNNYKDMLKSEIEILSKTDRSKDIAS